MDEALNRLKAFFEEMNAWEEEAGLLTTVNREDPVHEPLRKRIAEIQERHCTPGAKIRGYDVSRPPTYSEMAIDSCELVSSVKATIKARDTRMGLNDSYIFILKKIGEHWFLSEKMFVAAHGKAKRFYF